jgi:ankyrin repeat protein
MQVLYILINDMPISNLIKRKNIILNNEFVIPDIIDQLLKASGNYLITYIDVLLGDADINANNNYAFRCASMNAHLDVVECLAKYGAAEVLAPSWRCRYPRQ